MLELILRAISDKRFFPTLLCLLDLAAAGRYALCGAQEWRMIVYWTAAAALTAVVTW
jgi:hypothetical protein